MLEEEQRRKKEKEVNNQNLQSNTISQKNNSNNNKSRHIIRVITKQMKLKKKNRFKKLNMMYILKGNIQREESMVLEGSIIIMGLTFMGYFKMI